ncbi:carbon starvation protein A [Bacillus thermocopriae]|uniref:Carbon starvation protein A n=1 Tax=Neobacillus thermocopriae TaxID=1215031 RepID=A0A6B3TS73_9BACI|nr:carbon starvation CstA family protein [Neobacillus thermocopriae]MED3624784.1 carbon starvation CstA family protein [Neobacillus thermocopriae]MED3713066.1 carbon starvation CstA family protein [Neobacillus thermocopriae]NEX78557.1 carbon starvation protein A [Neobacillus thermocopriae]
MKALKSILIWGGIATLGAVGFAIIALNRGESINAIWLLTAAVSVYAISYRFYSKFIAQKVFQLDDQRKTPAEIHNDGKDYVPTNKWVLFGHHFAAIAGAGPLVGPILAAQMGYLPGTIWIVVGVVLAGAVQDFVILFGSMRRDGKSLGEMIKDEMGKVTGLIAMIGILGIMIILLAVLALVVVKALVGSPWGMFTIAATIPIAILMGVYMRYIRPGRVGEASLIGIVLLVLSLIFGQTVAETPALAKMFTFSGEAIAIMMIIYGFIASVLPVWLLLAPRDYLSTFLKIGTIVGLALGIVIVAPHLEMPAMTKFIDGTGPVFAGNLFPFLFITIACGAVSGFHALVSSGTTPKMIETESHARPIGYGAMLMESFVAVMAMIAACVLTPGVYFAINSPAALIGIDVTSAANAVSSWGFTVTPQDLETLAKDVGESTILSRTGGAPTLAIGMAVIFSKVIGGKALMAFWYHFAILFEALFILTTIDAGTRVGRFMIQDIIGTAYKPFAKTDALLPNIIATTLCVSFWGYFLYQGVIDPLGGINTLWPLFGIANQMLAGLALLLGTTILFKMGKKAYVWVTLVPTTWLLIVTMSAGWQKLFHEDPKIGFLSHAKIFKEAYDNGKILAPAKTAAEMKQVLINDYVDAALCAIFMLVVVVVLFSALRIWYQVLSGKKLPLYETPYVPRNEGDFKKYA